MCTERDFDRALNFWMTVFCIGLILSALILVAAAKALERRHLTYPKTSDTMLTVTMEEVPDETAW